MPHHPFAISLFLPDGIPEGLKIIEKSNWSGCGFSLPRASFATHKCRPEFQRRGIYLLLSDLEFDPKIYVGEGDPLIDRLQSHVQNKEFWDLLIAFTSKDQNLNKASIQYLESHLIQLARNSGQFVVMNKNDLKEPSLSEMDRAICDEYFRELLLCLPVLGITFKRDKPLSSSSHYPSIKTKNVLARGEESPEGFQVFEGSQAVLRETPSIPSSIKALRAALIERKVLIKTKNNNFQFSQTYLFGSPSTASSVVLGRSSNGRFEWKDGKGRTMNDVEILNEG